jgi:predicted metal-dependent hydrolase
LIFDRPSDLTYELVRSRKRKKTLTLQVKRDGTIVLLAPYRFSGEEADRFFRDKEAWVRKKLAGKQEDSDSPDLKRKFLPGDTFLFHGDPYPLEIVDSDKSAPLTLSHGVFMLRSDKRAEGSKVFADWYKLQARQEFVERVNYYGRRFNLVPTGLTITSARTRYGSCSPSNRISLCFRLIMAPYPAMDYVILHELAHIKEKNHSRRFWSFLETILPGYKAERRWLKENGHLLRV